MLVAASIFSERMDLLGARWRLQGGLPPVPGQKVNNFVTSGPKETPSDFVLHWQKEGYRLLEPGVLEPVFEDQPPYKGTFVVYDWDTRQIIWQSNWGAMLATPSGYCFADSALYMTDVEGANIFRIDIADEPGKLLDRISHPYFNDLHGITRTKRGFLVPCSGTDVIVEVDLDGNLLYEWWAAEHGYTMTPSGRERPSGRGQEHRDQAYHTRFHATHMNEAVFRDADERYILALLFHQGQMIQIDRSLPEAEQQAEVVLDGLARPHGLKRTPTGWLLANTLGKELVVLDDDLQVVERIPYDGGWIQDCTRLSTGRILINDVDGKLIVELAGPPWEIVSTTRFPMLWRMGQLTEVPAEYEAGFRRSAATVSA